MVTIATVLKSGGDFTPEYVYRIMGQLSVNVSGDYRFVCLSDLDLECDTIPLETELTGWWSKMELFRLKEKTIYFDLDTIIHGNIDHIIDYPHKFTMISNLDNKGGYASGFMAWDGDYSYLLDTALRSDLSKYNSWSKWGDQGLISEHVNDIERLQDIDPDIVSSHKWSTIERRRQTPIVMYHGRPRPHETGWTI